MTAPTIPVARNGIYEIAIHNLGHSGEGVGRYQDFTVFVPGALPGETVEVKITTVKKNYAVGELRKVLQAAPGRIEPKCPLYAECGGCQLQHMDYRAQLAAKRQTVVNAIERIGKLRDIVIHPVLGAANPWYYRNKMQFPTGSAGGKPVVGCYAQGTHRIIDTEECLIQHGTNNQIAGAVRDILAELGIETYNEVTGQGVMRHVLGRVGVATGEVMVVLVTATNTLPHRERIIERLTGSIKGLTSIVHNVNSRRTNVILGDRTETVWGRDTITDRIGDFTFHISALSFFQVNNEQTEVLYRQAVEYAGLTGRETVIDAYCGTGTIALFLAQKAAKVYGIEIVAPAIENARLNAKLNKVDNVEFTAGDAVEILPRLYAQGIRPDVIVVDPPRVGCEKIVLETFAQMQPDRIIYAVSYTHL
ncbi:MAG: 23S rRNA (uracil(1939)-C(5))-methyltransferase RlmD, partial [Negativicutes bacterium]|nr:23S rRNA (uracil(1939)-C(5))-methyltransferase RlmD [Negativicutes bacterium]